MSSIILNTIIILVIAAPFIYMALKSIGKSKHKSEFLNAAKAAGLQLTRTETWTYGNIGYDSKQNIFCFQSLFNDHKLMTVAASQVKGVQLHKDYGSYSGENPDLSLLNEVSLRIKTDAGKEEIWTLFQKKADEIASSEIMIAKEWQALMTKSTGNSNV